MTTATADKDFLKVGQKATFVLGAVAKAQFVDDARPQIAFAGRSNVGKSSLQNALLGRNGLVRTSRTPGRTREINFFDLAGRGLFVDLPGFGYARGGKATADVFAALVGQFLSHPVHPALVIYVLDSLVIDSDVDQICLRRILDAGVPCLPLMNKADRLNQSQRTRHGQLIADNYGLDAPPAFISAHSGQGLPEVRERLLDLLLPPPEVKK